MKLRGAVDLLAIDGDINPAMFAAYLDDQSAIDPSRIRDFRHMPNLVTNLGRSGFVSRIINGTTAAFFVGCVTDQDTGTAYSADTLRLNVASSIPQIISSRTVFQTYTMRFAGVFQPGDFNNTVRGIGLTTVLLLPPPPDSELWAVTNVVPAIGKSNTESLVYDWRILLST